MPEGPAVTCQAHFTDGGFEQLNKGHAGHILKGMRVQPNRDPGPAGSQLLLSLLPNVASLVFTLVLVFSWLLGNLSYQLGCKTPEHQSPRKRRQVFSLYAYETEASIMPCQAALVRKKQEAFKGNQTLHLMDRVNFRLLIITGVLEHRRGKTKAQRLPYRAPASALKSILVPQEKMV